MNNRNTHPLLILLFVVPALFQCCGAKADDTAVWLARSCVGEAGWNAWQTGECASILHIYSKRAALTGETTLQNAQRYSAAIKHHRGKRNRWVVALRADGGRPDKWPAHLDWQRFRADWMMTILVVELFLQDMVADPLPLAAHYGSPIDTPPPGVRLMKTKFRNRFYRLKGRL